MTTSDRSETEEVRGPSEAAAAMAGCCGFELAAPAAGERKWSPATMMAAVAAGAGSERAWDCPMTRMCGGMMRGGGRRLAWSASIAALALVTLGVIIALAPQVLSWLVAGGLVSAGAVVLFAAVRFRKPRAPEE